MLNLPPPSLLQLYVELRRTFGFRATDQAAGKVKFKDFDSESYPGRTATGTFSRHVPDPLSSSRTNSRTNGAPAPRSKYPLIRGI